MSPGSLRLRLLAVGGVQALTVFRMVLKADVFGVKPCGVNDGADGCFALGGPPCTIAVGDLALHDRRSEGALTGVVGDLHRTGEGHKGQRLIAGTAKLALEVMRQITRCRRLQDISQAPLQGSSFHGKGGTAKAVARPAKPKADGTQSPNRQGTGTALASRA